MVAFGAAQLFQAGVYLGKGAAQGLSESEEVSVVVDINRNTENPVQIRSQGHAVAETGEVGKIPADDAVRIVGRAGESKADGNRLDAAQLVNDGLETGHHGFQAEVQIVGVGRKHQGFQDEFLSFHGAETHGIAAGIQGEHYACIVDVFSHNYESLMNAFPERPSIHTCNGVSTRTWRSQAVSSTAGRASSALKSKESPLLI